MEAHRAKKQEGSETMILLPDKIQKNDLIGNTPNAHKEKILWYMKNAPVSWAVGGIVKDIMTGKSIPYGWKVHADGEYMWHSYLWYYVEKYDYELPADFVDKIVKSDCKALRKEWKKISQ